MVDRYDLEVDWRTDDGDAVYVLCLSDSGEYVKFEDYQDLSDELADTEAELQLLKDKIADIFREM